MKAVFFSDAHLKRQDHERAALIGHFITAISRDADMVVVMGDLFEFYHGYDNFTYPWFRTIIDVLKEAVSGKTAYFIEGNHEFGLGRYFEEYTGMHCLDEVSLDLDGKRVFLSHGDTVGVGSLKSVLKSPFIYLLMDLFRPHLTWKIAMGCRVFLSRKKKVYNERILERFRAFGRDKLRNGYDAVILAHSHMPDIVSLREGDMDKVYINTGDLIKHFTYVEYTSAGGFRLKNWKTPIGLQRAKSTSTV